MAVIAVGGKLVIVMTAPKHQPLDLHGSSSLAIENYRQERLTIDLSGNADVTAAGEVNVLNPRHPPAQRRRTWAR